MIKDTVLFEEVHGMVVSKKVEYDFGSDKKTEVGVGILASLQYQANLQFTVDAGAEYNHLGKFSDVKLDHYGAKIGVCYSF